MTFHNADIRSYPVLALTLTAFACVYLTYRFPIAGIVLGTALFLCTVGLLIRKRRIERLSVFSFLLSVCTLLCLYSFHVEDRRLLQYENQTVYATLRLESIDFENSYYTQYTCTVLSCNQTKIGNKKATLTVSDASYQRYDILEGNFSLSLPMESNNGFQSRLYQYANEILISAVPSEGEIPRIIGKDPPLLEPIERFRSYLSSKLELLPQSAAGLAKALLLGDKSELPTKVKNDFSGIGASHILAISGLHLSIMTLLLLIVLRRLPLSKMTRTVLWVGSLIFLVLLTGAAPSVRRAAAMLAASWLLSFTYRRIHPFSLFGLVGLGFAMLDPHILFHVGFLLSYFSTLGVLAVFCNESVSVSGTPIQRLLHYLRTSFWSSLGAILFTIPISMYFFGRISYLGILSSLLLIPLCTLSIYATLLFLLLPTVLCRIPLLSQVFSIPLQAMTDISDGIAAWRVPSFYLHAATAPYFLLFFSAFLLLFTFGFPHKKRLFCLILVALCCLQIGIIGITKVTEADAVFVSVESDEKAEVLLIGNRDTQVMICDSPNRTSLLLESLSLYSPSYYKEAPEAIVFSDYTARAATSVSYLLSYVPIGSLWFPRPTQTWEQEIASELEEIASRNHCEILYYDVDFSIGSLSFSFCQGMNFSVQHRNQRLVFLDEFWNCSQKTAEFYQRAKVDPRTVAFMFRGYAMIPSDLPTGVTTLQIGIDFLDGDKAEFLS